MLKLHKVATGRSESAEDAAETTRTAGPIAAGAAFFMPEHRSQCVLFADAGD